MTDKLTAAEANRLFYADKAVTYDQHEDCITDGRLRERLRRALAAALERVGKSDARILDACGGSGNASLMLAEMGHRPVTLDVSPEMLAIYGEKAAGLGFEPQTVVGDVEALLSDSGEWDLVVFSSALHHLDNPTGVVLASLGRLAPGGCLVTMFDPRQLGSLGLAIRKLDYGFHLAAHRRGEFLGVVGRRLSGSARRGDGSNLGQLAERHAMAGLDDGDLSDAIKSAGFSIIDHTQYAEARFALTRFLLRACRQPTAFSLLVQRGDPGTRAEKHPSR